MKSPISPGKDWFVVPDHLPTAIPNHGADTALVAGTGGRLLSQPTLESDGMDDV